MSLVVFSITAMAAPGEVQVVANETIEATQSSDSVGQSFVSPKTGQLKELSFVGNINVSWDLKIWAGNQPNDSAPVYTETFPGMSTDGNTFQSFTLNSPLPVLEGQTYTVILESTENFQIARSSDLFADGVYWYESLGTYYGLHSWDLVFRFTVTESAKPTLTAFNQPIATTAANTPVGVTFTNLIAQGDEAYADGNVDAFVVKSVPVGSLSINGSPFMVGSNNRIAEGTPAVWTPPIVYSGDVTALTLVAEGGGLVSDTDVAASITVEKPSPAAGTENWDNLAVGNDKVVGVAGTSAIQTFEATANGRLQDVALQLRSDSAWQLQILDGEGPDGNVLYTKQLPAIESLDTFIVIPIDEVITLSANQMYSIRVSDGTNLQFNYGSNNYADGQIYFFTGGVYSAWDQEDMVFEVTQVSSPVPRLRQFSDPVITTLEDTPVTITFEHLLAESDASYSQGSITAFRVEPEIYGSLQIDGNPASTSNNLITASKPAVWTPGSDYSGNLPLFTAVAMSHELASETIVSARVNIIAVDDGFRYVATSTNPLFVEDSAAVNLFSYFSFSASDSGDDPTGVGKLVFEVSGVADGNQESLVYRGQLINLIDRHSGNAGSGADAWEWSVGVDSGTATVEITQQMPLAAFATAMDNVAYRHAGNSMTGTERTIILRSIYDQDEVIVPTGSPLQSEVSFEAVNDLTVVTGVDGGTMTVIASGGPVAQTLFDDISISDADTSHLSGGTVFINNNRGTRGDWALEASSGVLSGDDSQFAVDESIIVEGKVIGHINGGNDGQNGGWLWINLTTTDATFEAVEKLIAALTYSEPFIVKNVEFNLYVGQGGANHVSHFGLTVLPNPPIIGGLDGSIVSGVVGSSVNIDPEQDISLNDPDTDFLTGGILTISKTSALSGDFSLSGNEHVAGDDHLISAGEKILYGTNEIARVDSSGQGNQNLVLTLLAESTEYAVQELLNALAYTGTQSGDHTFTLTVSDAAGTDGAESAPVSFTVTAIALPKITMFSGPVAQTNEDEAIEITFASLADKGDESFEGGVVDGFKVTSVASGKLKIDGADFSIGTNDRITASKSATWTPAENANGELGAISVVAVAGTLVGETAVTATVDVLAVDDPAVISAPIASDPVFTENGDAVTLFTQFNISDIDDVDQTGKIQAIQVQVSPVADGSDEVLVFMGIELVLTAGNSGTVNTDDKEWSYQVSLQDSTATVDLAVDLLLADTVTALQEMAYLHKGEQLTGSERQVTVNWLEDVNSLQLLPPSLAQSIVTLTSVNDVLSLSGLDGRSAMLMTSTEPAQLSLFKQVAVHDVDETLLFDFWLANRNYPTTSSGSWGLASGQKVLSGGNLTFEDADVVTVDGVAIGTVSYGFTGQQGGELYLIFESGVTAQELDRLLTALTYFEPQVLESTEFELSIYEGTGESYSVFNIMAVSHPPKLFGFDGVTASTVMGTPVPVVTDSDVAVSDADNQDFEGGLLTISRTTSQIGDFQIGQGEFTSGDDLQFEAGESLYYEGEEFAVVRRSGQESDNLEIALAASATPENMSEFLKTLVYNSNDPGLHNFEIRLRDGASSRVVGTSSIYPFSIRIFIPGGPGEPDEPDEPDGSGDTDIVIDTEEQLEGEIGDVEVTESGVLNGDTVTGSIINAGIVNVDNLGSDGHIIGGTVQGQLKSQGTLTDVTVGNNTTVEGGRLEGVIRNNGSISNVTIAPGAGIEGGTVSGSISGSSESPAFVNAEVQAGTILENVIIGPDAVISGDIVFGDNVRFASPDNIPPGLNLTGMLDGLSWRGEQHIPGVSLDDVDLTTAPDEPEMLAELHGIPLLESNISAMRQSAASGELELNGEQFVSRLFPVEVRQAAVGVEQGLRITEDGDIELTTAAGLSVISYPVPAQRDTLISQLLDIGLAVSFDERANIHVKAPGSSDDSGRFQARPDVVATIASEGAAPGIDLRPRSLPANTVQAFMVYENETGVMQQQALNPVPADWFALKLALQGIADNNQVRIDTAGVISVDIEGRRIQVIADYEVTAAEGDPAEELSIAEAGDVNADGVVDFRVTYIDGRTQLLYQFP